MFNSIPHEIICCCFNYLKYQDLINLKYTNEHFFKVIDKQFLSKRKNLIVLDPTFKFPNQASHYYEIDSLDNFIVTKDKNQYSIIVNNSDNEKITLDNEYNYQCGGINIYIQSSKHSILKLSYKDYIKIQIFISKYKLLKKIIVNYDDDFYQDINNYINTIAIN